MSLASYPAVTVTAIAMSQDRDDLRGIARVQWRDPHGGLEDSSIEDLIRWLDHNAGIAYVSKPDATRGPRIRAVGSVLQRYITSNPDDETVDTLLTLPRLGSGPPPDRSSRAHRATRQVTWRWPMPRSRPAT